MIEIPVTLFFSLFVLAGLVLIFALWIYYDRQGYRQRDRLNQTVFHCVRCGALYGVHGATKKAACPECGFHNVPLRF